MAGVNGNRKGKKDDNGIGTAIDFMLSNAKLVLGVGGAAMLGIATLAVKRVRALHRPFISPAFYFCITSWTLCCFTDVRPCHQCSHQPHQDGAKWKEKLGGASVDGFLPTGVEP